MIGYIQKILLAWVVCVLAIGCIKEDYDDCDNVVIYFQYLADGETNVLNDYITKVDLYVFDEGGHIMGVGHYSEDELKRYAAIPSFRLTPGKKYRVVAVGNAFNRTEVENLTSETDFNKIFIQHPAWGSGEGKVDGHDHNYLGQLDFTMPGRTEVENLTSETDFNKIFIQHPAWGSGEGKVDGHDHNYLGQLDFTMPGDENFTVYRDTVTLYSAHINVDIEINGLPAPDALGEGGEIPYELRIEESNAQTDFNGDINMEEKGTCYPALIYDKERNCYRTDDLCLFRMNDHAGHFDEEYCEHRLVLIDKRTGKRLVDDSIYNYVNDNKDEIDLTKQEATLPIEINFHTLGVVIKVPDWYIENLQPGWE